MYKSYLRLGNQLKCPKVFIIFKIDRRLKSTPFHLKTKRSEVHSANSSNLMREKIVGKMSRFKGILLCILCLVDHYFRLQALGKKMLCSLSKQFLHLKSNIVLLSCKLTSKSFSKKKIYS